MVYDTNARMLRFVLLETEMNEHLLGYTDGSLQKLQITSDQVFTTKGP